MSKVLRVLWWGALIAVAAAVPGWLVRAGHVFAAWAGANPDVLWAVCALLTMPLLAAAMTIYDQLPTQSRDVSSSVVQDFARTWRVGPGPRPR